MSSDEQLTGCLAFEIAYSDADLPSRYRDFITSLGTVIYRDL